MSGTKRWTQTLEVSTEVANSRPPPRIRSISVAEMKVAFQPIVDLRTREIFAAEMLARCQCDSLQDPTVLFEQAAIQGATGRLGRLTRDVGFDRAPDLPLFINLHPHELSERWIVRPDDPMNFFEHRLYLEITESAALDYFELCRSALREICDRLGAKLVIDDFGAGHSNLLRIAELEPSVVKLDRSLVETIHQSSTKQKIVKHIVNLCEDLGAEVVAEGIELPEELAAVIDGGAHYGQGYLFARPDCPMQEITWP